MLVQLMKRVSRKLAISVFAWFEVLGLPRDGKRKPDRAS
jgi:hypothetical protein